MSDTERLEAAAARLEQRAGWSLADAERMGWWGYDLAKRVGEDRAVAALLRAAVVEVGTRSEIQWPSPTVPAALAVADAVLGVPASPKEQTDA